MEVERLTHKGDDFPKVVDTLEFMADNTSIPILLDGDTGYGNFNNARRLVRKV